MRLDINQPLNDVEAHFTGVVALGTTHKLLSLYSTESVASANGQTEGNVTSVKLIKRPMCGRIWLDLVRRIVEGNPTA